MHLNNSNNFGTPQQNIEKHTIITAAQVRGDYRYNHTSEKIGEKDNKKKNIDSKDNINRKEADGGSEGNFFIKNSEL